MSDDYDQGGYADAGEDASAQGAVVKYTGARLPWSPGVEKKYPQIDQGGWRVLVDTIFPAAKTAEAIGMALAYCKKRNLDIFKRPVHIVPMYSTALKRMVETVWPGISELRTTAFRTKQYAGCDPVEWGPIETREFKGVKEVWEGWGRDRKKVRDEEVTMSVTFHEWGRMTVYRLIEGMPHPVKFVGPQVYWAEICAKERSGIPNERWRGSPNGQHEKTIEAAALRKAFPEELGSEMTAEEMEGQVMLASNEPAPMVHEPVDPNAGIADVSTKAITSQPAQAIDGEVITPKQQEKKPAPAAVEKKSAPPAELKKPAPTKAAPAEPEVDVGALLMELDERLKGVNAADDVNEVMAEMDIESRLSGTEDGVGMARDLAQRHINRIRNDEDEARQAAQSASHEQAAAPDDASGAAAPDPDASTAQADDDGPIDPDMEQQRAAAAAPTLEQKYRADLAACTAPEQPGQLWAKTKPLLVDAGVDGVGISKLYDETIKRKKELTASTKGKA